MFFFFFADAEHLFVFCNSLCYSSIYVLSDDISFMPIQCCLVTAIWTKTPKGHHVLLYIMYRVLHWRDVPAMNLVK